MDCTNLIREKFCFIIKISSQTWNLCILQFTNTPITLSTRKTLRQTADANRQTRQRATPIISGQNFTGCLKSQKKKATTKLICHHHRNLKNSPMISAKNTSNQTESSCRNLVSSSSRHMHSANKSIYATKITLTAYFNCRAPLPSQSQKSVCFLQKMHRSATTTGRLLLHLKNLTNA